MLCRADSLCCVHGAQRAAFERLVERALCGFGKWFIFSQLPRQFFFKKRPQIRKELHYNVPKMGRKDYTMYMRMCQHREADKAI